MELTIYHFCDHDISVNIEKTVVQVFQNAGRNRQTDFFYSNNPLSYTKQGCQIIGLMIFGFGLMIFGFGLQVHYLGNCCLGYNHYLVGYLGGSRYLGVKIGFQKKTLEDRIQQL